jgi:uncharacterized protein
MPCPQGVNIPAKFSTYNDYCMFGDRQKASGMYSMILMGGFGGKRSDASLCKGCKQCVERCPQHIAVPEQLKAVAKELGSPVTDSRLAASKMHSEKQKSPDKHPFGSDAKGANFSRLQNLRNGPSISK